LLPLIVQAGNNSRPAKAKQEKRLLCLKVIIPDSPYPKSASPPCAGASSPPPQIKAQPCINPASPDSLKINYVYGNKADPAAEIRYIHS